MNRTSPDSSAERLDDNTAIRFGVESTVPDRHETEPHPLSDGEVQNDSNDQSGISSIPLVLRDAAFISSKGRVYRLFPEEEKSPLDISFVLDTQRDHGASTKPERVAEERPEIFPFKNDLKNDLNRFVATDVLIPSDEIGRESDSSEIPIDETIKRSRAVQGVCGRYQTTLPIRIFDSLSRSSAAKANPSARSQTGLRKAEYVAVEKENRAGALEERLLPEKPTASDSTVRGTNVERRLKDVGESRRQTAESPLQQGVTLCGRPLFESEIPGRLDAVRSEMVPILESMPDFFEVRRKDDASKPDVAPVSFDFKIVREEEKKPEEPTVAAADLLEETTQEAVPETTHPTMMLRMIRLNLPAVPKRRFRAGLFEKQVRPVDRSGGKEHKEPVILKLEGVSENDVPVETATLPFRPAECGNALETVPEVPELLGTSVVPEEDEQACRKERTESVFQMHPSSPVVEWAHWSPSWPKYLDSLHVAATEQIRRLSDHLESSIQSGTKVVSFNSFHPGEGCTTSTLCAARELAARGRHVLLIDAHEQHPELGRLLAVPFDPHLFEIVLLEERLEFLPWCDGTIDIEVDGKIRSHTFGELIGSIREDFDLLLLDNGPLVEGRLSDRVRQWREMTSDGVLLVVNAKNSDSIHLKSIAGRLESHGIELLGITENYV